jgi:hypothetical protein
MIAKWLKLAGDDHLHCGTADGKLEGDPMTVQGYYNVCRETKNEIDLPRGVIASPSCYTSEDDLSAATLRLRSFAEVADLDSLDRLRPEAA